MDKTQLYALTGHLDQIASVRRVVYQDGDAAGLCCAQFRNGPLEFDVMLNKCLDLAQLRYRGINLSFLSQTGVQRGDMCGAMFTAGLDNIHAGRTVDGVFYPLHGKLRFAPADDIELSAQFDGNRYILQASGKVSSALHLDEKLVFHRTIRTEYGIPSLTIVDKIENCSFKDIPICLLYHCNAGYPLLSPGSRVLFPSKDTLARDEFSQLDGHRVMDEPKAEAPEQVFQHICAATPKGETFGAIINDSLELALVLRWNIRELPLLTQWKSIAAGNYAMALEPCNTGFSGRAEPGEFLSPFEKKVVTFRIEIAEGKAAISNLFDEYNTLMVKSKFVSK